MVNNTGKSNFFLRFGIGLVFLYAAIAALLDPTSWIGFIPRFAQKIIPALTFITLFSVYQIALAFWLFSGKKTFYASILSAVTIFVIIISNLGLFDIVFRDVAIFFSCIALAFMSKKK